MDNFISSPHFPADSTPVSTIMPPPRPSLRGAPAVLYCGHKLSPRRLAYWLNICRQMRGKADIVDPLRHDLKVFRDQGLKGWTVYRAATKGKHGKSAETVTI